MLGRWRTQQSAKHLEEERQNAERERSSSDVTSPASGAASPRSPDAGPPSSITSPRSADGSFHSMHTPEPPSTPASLDGSTRAQPGTTAGSGPDPAIADPSYVYALAPPDTAPAPGPATVPEPEPVPDPVGGADTPLAAKDGTAPDSSAPGDSARDTPVSTKEEVEDLPVAEKEATSSDDKIETAEDVPTSSHSEIRQTDAKQEISSVEEALKAAGDIRSGDLETPNAIGDSTGAKNEGISEGASKITDEKPSDVIETTKGHGKISPLSKSSSDKQSLEAESNESDSNPPPNERQTSKPGKLYIVHNEIGRKLTIKCINPPPQRPLNGAPPVQVVETYSRPGSPFETINYLSHSALGQYAQRTYGAAKSNNITGCPIRMAEMGVSLAAAPVLPFLRCCQTPLQCVDRLVYRGFTGFARAFACAPTAAGVCCGVPNCECDIPIVFTGEAFEIDGKQKQE